MTSNASFCVTASFVFSVVDSSPRYFMQIFINLSCRLPLSFEFQTWLLLITTLSTKIAKVITP